MECRCSGASRDIGALGDPRVSGVLGHQGIRGLSRVYVVSGHWGLAGSVGAQGPAGV